MARILQVSLLASAVKMSHDMFPTVTMLSEAVGEKFFP